MDEGLMECMLIELSPHLGVFKLHIYPKENRDLTPYSESPVQALQELNGVSRAETEPLKGILVPIWRPTVAEIMTVVCWSVYCCHSDACPRDNLGSWFALWVSKMIQYETQQFSRVRFSGGWPAKRAVEAAYNSAQAPRFGSQNLRTWTYCIIYFVINIKFVTTLVTDSYGLTTAVSSWHWVFGTYEQSVSDI
jgi:hypothetical protein